MTSLDDGTRTPDDGRGSYHPRPQQYQKTLYNRGVQYVHWVMHKCIMVKVGGKITHKVCKKLVNVSKTGGNFEKQGEIITCVRIRGKCTKRGKIGGNSKFVVDD